MVMLWAVYIVNIVIGGDFNVNLDSRSNIACMLTQFIDNCSLLRCDKLLQITFPLLILTLHWTIDYVLVSTDKIVTSFAVLDPDVNCSDHLPLTVIVLCTNDNCSGNQITSSASTQQPQASSNKTTMRSCRYCFSNMADDEEAVVLLCTSFIVCALCVHVSKKRKKTTRSVGES